MIYKVLLSYSAVSLALMANVSFAEDLVLISDIDDTIKITGIGSVAENNSNALKTILDKFKKGGILTKTTLQSHSFYGFNTLYQAFKNSNPKMGQHNLKYVSGAPGIVTNLAEFFLKNYTYPDNSNSNIFYRPNANITTSDFKINSITDIINKSPSKTNFILIGDNGEMDQKVYNKIKKRFNNRIKATFIHMVYAVNSSSTNKAKDGQISYFTAVDLATQFFSMGLIAEKDVLNIVDNSAGVLEAGKNNDEFYRTWMTGCKFWDNRAPNFQSTKTLVNKINTFKTLFLKKFPACNKKT